MPFQCQTVGKNLREWNSDASSVLQKILFRKQSHSVQKSSEKGDLLTFNFLPLPDEARNYIRKQASVRHLAWVRVHQSTVTAISATITCAHSVLSSLWTATASQHTSRATPQRKLNPWAAALTITYILLQWCCAHCVYIYSCTVASSKSHTFPPTSPVCVCVCFIWILSHTPAARKSKAA